MKFFIALALIVLFPCASYGIVLKCKAGYYSNGFACAKCPDSHPRSADNNSGGITSCFYAQSIVGNETHSIYEYRCYYQSTCTNVFLSCMGGYWRPDTTEDLDMKCINVPNIAYSVYPTDYKNCPTYAAYGSTMTGATTGTPASDITDCYIPSGRSHSDLTGVFTYTSNCHYTK